MGLRCLHLIDSQVVLGAVAKGRSPSRRLNFVIKRINVIILAGDLEVFVAFVLSADNPADRPSRFAKALQCATRGRDL